MVKKVTTFDEVAGHERISTYFQEQIRLGTLPQFLILEGAEGLGKTTLGKLIAMGLCCKSTEKPCYGCASCVSVRENVIENNRSSEAVKLFNMSVDGGKDAAREVLANLTLGVTGLSRKVILLDEAHGMTEQAQDVFLADTEFLPKGVYIILMTTNSYQLRDTLKSRAFIVRLNPLSQSETLDLLKRRAAAGNITVQGGDASLSLLAGWSEGKPRAALNLLNGFAPGQSISSEILKSLIGYLDAEQVAPLLKYLGGSLVHGISYAESIRLSKSILDVSIEALKLKKGLVSAKLPFDEAVKLREAVKDVPEESLILFISELASAPKLTKESLLSAFIRAHKSYCRLFSKEDNSEVLGEELRQIRETAPFASLSAEAPRAPSVAELLRSAQTVKGD
jgi:DNA polymerase III delta prime subunit